MGMSSHRASFASQFAGGLQTSSSDSVAQSVFTFSSGVKLLQPSAEETGGCTKRSRPAADCAADRREQVPRCTVVPLSVGESPSETAARDAAAKAAREVIESTVKPLAARFHNPAMSRVVTNCGAAGLEDSEVPAVVLFAGLNVGDHGSLFRFLCARLRATVSPFVVHLRASDCSTPSEALSLATAACMALATHYTPGQCEQWDAMPSAKVLRAAAAAVGHVLTPKAKLQRWFRTAFMPSSPSFSSSLASPPPPTSPTLHGYGGPRIILVVEDAEAVSPQALESLVEALHQMRSANSASAGARVPSLAVSAGLVAAGHELVGAECGVPVQLVLGACATAAAWQGRLTARAAACMRMHTIRLERPLGMLDAAADALAVRGALPVILSRGALAAILEHALQYSLSAQATATAARLAVSLHHMGHRLAALASPLARLPPDPATTDGGLRSLFSTVPSLSGPESRGGGDSDAQHVAGHATALAAALAADERSVPRPTARSRAAYAPVSRAVLSSPLWRACACRVNGLPVDVVDGAASLPSVRAEAVRLGVADWATVWPVAAAATSLDRRAKSLDGVAAGDSTLETDWSSSSDDDAATAAALRDASKRGLLRGKALQARRQAPASSEPAAESSADAPPSTPPQGRPISPAARRASRRSPLASSPPRTPRRQRRPSAESPSSSSVATCATEPAGSPPRSRELRNLARLPASDAGLGVVRGRGVAKQVRLREAFGRCARARWQGDGRLPGVDKIGARLSRRKRWYTQRVPAAAAGDSATVRFIGSRVGPVSTSAASDATEGGLGLAVQAMDAPAFVLTERPLVTGRRASLTRWYHDLVCRRLATARVLRCVRQALALAAPLQPASSATTLRALHAHALESGDEPVPAPAAGSARPREGVAWASLALSGLGRRAAASLRDAQPAAAAAALAICARLLRARPGEGVAGAVAAEADAVADAFEPVWEPEGVAAWLEPWCEEAERLAAALKSGPAALASAPASASATAAAAGGAPPAPAPAPAVAGRRGSSLSRRRKGLAAALAAPQAGPASFGTGARSARWQAAQWLIDLMHCALRPPTSLPLHEAVTVTDGAAIREGLAPCARSAVVAALRAPGAYLLSAAAAAELGAPSKRPALLCGESPVPVQELPPHALDLAGVAELDAGLSERAARAGMLRVAGTGASGELPDVTVAWRLFEHAGRSVPLKVWYLAFREAFAGPSGGDPYAVLLGRTHAARLGASSTAMAGGAGGAGGGEGRRGGRGRVRRGKRRPQRAGAAVAPVEGTLSEEDEDGEGDEERVAAPPSGGLLAPCVLREGLSEEDVRARFCQAVRDLAHVGALRSSSRRAGDGFVQRLLLELVAWQ